MPEIGPSRVIPRSVRQRISRALGRLDRRGVLREVRQIAAGRGPILAGPWTGEVGFEVLYWLPFLRWVLREADIDRTRVVACSRGGVDTWYADVASRYFDVFDYVTPDTLRLDGLHRKATAGERKQTTPGELDTSLIASLRDTVGAEVSVLHPSLMFRLYRRYFWQHAGTEWLHEMARYERWPVPGEAPPLPPTFVAVKFYFNDCLSDTPVTRDAIQGVVTAIARSSPVVSLATGLHVDDHADHVTAGAVALPALADPRRNLGRQAAVLARASRFVGTYGGYSYVPPFYGVPSTAVYTEADGFARTHLRMAQSAFARVQAPPLIVQPLSEALADLRAR